MLDRLTYVSSTGSTIRFGDTDSHILINTNDVRDYEWQYSQSYKRITNFSRDTVARTLPVLIYGKDVKTIANNIFEIIENDVLLKKYGKLYSGDYYMRGYFTASSKPSYTANGFLKLSLTFVSDKPYWIKETNYQYRAIQERMNYLQFTDESGTLSNGLQYVIDANNGSVTLNGTSTKNGWVNLPISCHLRSNTYYKINSYHDGKFVFLFRNEYNENYATKPNRFTVISVTDEDDNIELFVSVTLNQGESINNVVIYPKVLEYSADDFDYPFDYPYDFLPLTQTQDIINPSFAEQNVRIVIYGECVNPVVMIDEHVYGVNTTIDENEYVTIDTAEKTIVLTKQDGTAQNVFNARNRDYYIFQKIPSGKHTISVLPSTNVDLTILEERSEPKWQ